MIKPLGEPDDVVALVQLWTDEQPSAAGWAERLLPGAAAGGFEVSAWLVREHVLKQPVERQEPAAYPGTVKLAGTAYRRDDFSAEAFFEYWRTVHAPVSASVPGVGGYVVSEVLEAIAGSWAPDALIEQWYPDEAAFDQSGRYPASRGRVGRRPALREDDRCLLAAARARAGPAAGDWTRAAGGWPMPELREHLLQTPHSGIRRMLELAAAVPDPVMLVNGDPNFTTPGHIIDAAAAAAHRGGTGYAPGGGLPDLRAAIAAKVSARNGITASADQVCVTTGACGGLYTVLMLLAGPGDEVLLPDPGWSNYAAMTHVLGARGVGYPAGEAAAGRCGPTSSKP